MKFRSDINGLRAIAVLAVMVFHFNPLWLPSGFAGVDIFFVISGFLMTGIISKGVSNDTFSLLKFYSSRIRRIVPPLLTMIVCLTILGYFFFTPSLYSEFSEHAKSSLLFISNITYWKESGYFDSSSAGKLLLHTWSLSVEWQFYIIYPVVILILTKVFSLNSLNRIILFLFCIAFSFSICASYKWPTASYFLLSSRSWEMLLGGVAFLNPVNVENTRKQYTYSTVGIILILLSFFVYSASTPWPGYYALLPTLGAFLLILSSSNSILTNNLVFQKIGLWSYSLYLYHWPVLVINYRFSTNIGFFTFFGITFICAITSYYTIEKMKWKAKYILSAMLITLICLFAIQKNDGIDSRIKKNNVLNSEDYKLSMILGHNILGRDGVPEMNFGSRILNSNTRNNLQAVLFGDSHAAHYSFGIQDSGNKISILTKWVPSCLNLSDYFSKPKFAWQDDSWVKECRNNDIENKELNGAPLIISYDWIGYQQLNDYQCKNDLCSYTGENVYELLNTQLVKLVKKYHSSPIIFIAQTPAPNNEIVNCYKNRLSGCAETYADKSPKIIEMNNFLRDFANKNGVYFIDPSDILCAKGKCKASVDGYSLYFDSGHFSAYGSRYVWRYIENKLIDKGLVIPISQ
ncbi:acyltransferase family protein [Escherichia coli]|uniref:acyltransferase family protein n=1 Tax=Escherichia coli TaxID=562 RepID=UPI00351C013B